MRSASVQGFASFLAEGAIFRGCARAHRPEEGLAVVTESREVAETTGARSRLDVARFEDNVQFGLGPDREPPSQGERFAWGIRPSFLLRTATDEGIGTRKWSAGPAVAAVYFAGPWVAGLVAQNLWSFAGDGDRADVDLMTLRPLLNDNLPGGWYRTTGPSIGANWKVTAGDRWLVPLGGGAGKVYQIGGLRMSTALEAYDHVASPALGPTWQRRT